MRAWRVEYQQNSGYVFYPRGPPPDETNLNHLRARHLAWENGFASPFVSVFTDQAHALNWAIRQQASCVHEIKIENLRSIRGGTHDELLIIGPIPRNNLVRTIQSYNFWTELRELRECERRRVEALARAEAQRKHIFCSDTCQWYESLEDLQEDVDWNDYIEYVQNHL